MAVLFVVTEHSTFLSTERLKHYERIRARLEGAAGAPVESRHYLELGELNGEGAVVLSGSFAPWAAHDARALAQLGDTVRGYRGPVLGICAGMQLQAMFAGGTVARASGGPEQGYRAIDVLESDGLLAGLSRRAAVYQHHTDEVAMLPDGFELLATSPECPVQAIVARDRSWWGTQFHPEEFDAEHPAGERVLRNFFALTEVGVRHGVRR